MGAADQMPPLLAEADGVGKRVAVPFVMRNAAKRGKPVGVIRIVGKIVVLIRIRPQII